MATGDQGYLDPDPGPAGTDVDGEELADPAETEGRERALGPEEAAMRVTGEDVADDRDPATERAEYLEDSEHA